MRAEKLMPVPIAGSKQGAQRIGPCAATSPRSHELDYADAEIGGTIEQQLQTLCEDELDGRRTALALLEVS